jgi:uncharacterized protein YggE
MSKRALFLTVLSASLAFAQLDSNSITVTASRNSALQADQAVFVVTVQSDTNASLDDIVAALQGSGITAANLTSASTPQLIFTGNPGVGSILAPLAASIQWSFSLPVALSKTKDTVASLTTLQQNITQKNKSLKLSFSIQGTQVSSQAVQSQTCSVSDLLSDARTQAQKLASAAGVTLGTILAMSSPTSNVVVPPAPYVASAAPCALTVKFAVTRFQ